MWQATIDCMQGAWHGGQGREADRHRLGLPHSGWGDAYTARCEADEGPLAHTITDQAGLLMAFNELRLLK